MAAVAEARKCRERHYPLSFYQPRQEREEDQRILTCFLEDTERRCRERVREERQRRGWLTVDVGLMMVLAHQTLPRTQTLLCKFHRFKIWDGGAAGKTLPPIQKMSPTPPYCTLALDVV
jgi:hypothetical protein